MARTCDLYLDSFPCAVDGVMTARVPFFWHLGERVCGIPEYLPWAKVDRHEWLSSAKAHMAGLLVTFKAFNQIANHSFTKKQNETH